MKSNIDDYLQQKIEIVEKRLDTLISEKEVPYNSLFQAARYSLLSGGKRLRPILTLATVETLGRPFEEALDPACALEMIHTYSLIHDDLPCMDDDDFRRGKPSLHKTFPESHAVLAGDFLLTFAFEVTATTPHLSSEQRMELTRLLAVNSGAPGMIGGQVMDIEGEGKTLDLARLRAIYELKTGALMQTAFEFGAIICKASPLHRNLLRQFGSELGLAFQIIDDTLDVLSHKNSDKKNNKSTYVDLVGLEKAKSMAETHFLAALENLKKIPYDTSLLVALAKQLVHRKR